VAATIPLLLMDLEAVPTSEHVLKPGDRLLFYTDGITNRKMTAGVPYEAERLATALDGARRFPADAAIDALVGDIEFFADGREPDDDQTLLLVGYDPAQARLRPGEA
jgi:sigma-B regulation protein RsbU (phosphoserine phosphatase)